MHTLLATLIATATSLTPLSKSTYQHVIATDDAIPSARSLRAIFDDRFASPRESHGERYAWDPWHVSRRHEDMPASRVAAGDDDADGDASETDKLEAAVASRRTAGDDDADSETGSDADSETGSLEAAVAAARAKDAKLKPARAAPARTGGSGLQYSMLRTPASSYFPEAEFEALCGELAAFGRSRLGCDAFTPPWLALYTDGHEMGWHTDASHGPWAFVLSLTPDGYHGRAESDTPSHFEGGETLLLDQGVLDYWRGYDGTRGLEAASIVERHDPTPFGRLLVFDGRVPHAVSRVKGSADPRRGRLVLTGWFSQPRPVADGGLADDEEQLVEDAALALEDALGAAYAAFDELGLARVVGFLAVRLVVAADGAVASADALCDTLKVDPSEQALEAECPDDATVRELLAAAFGEARFPAAAAPTTITLPLSFD